jgi:hypothetical protein
MAQPCTECGSDVPPNSGRRRFTCGPECSARRSARHATRPVFVKPTCSECGGECPDKNKGPAFLTCSEECARVRRNRLGAERVGRRPVRQCVDCEADLTGLGARAERCRPCARRRHRILGNARQASRRAQRLLDAEAKVAEAQRRSHNRLMSTYGISLERFGQMIAEQDGRCAICRELPMGRGKGDMLVIDHCHQSGDVRGLLCGHCNIAIGLMSDSPDRLRQAAAYLVG